MRPPADVPLLRARPPSPRTRAKRAPPFPPCPLRVRQSGRFERGEGGLCRSPAGPAGSSGTAQSAPPCPQSVATYVPPIQLPVSRAAPCGRPLVAPWPSPALSPAARALAPAILRRRVAAYLPAPLGGPRRPGGVAPRPWGRLQCPPAGKRRPQRRGPPAAAPPPLPPWASGSAPCGRPSRPSQVLARLRACDNCRPVRA